MRQSKLLLPFGLALALTGCISFGAKVPDSLLRLTATSTVPAEVPSVFQSWSPCDPSPAVK